MDNIKVAKNIYKRCIYIQNLKEQDMWKIRKIKRTFFIVLVKQFQIFKNIDNGKRK
jgi:hypothetical protein